MMDYISKIEQGLGKKFITGTNADWAGARIMPLKGSNFYGLFLVDESYFTGEKRVILLCRIFDPLTEECKDTEILVFDAEEDDVKIFIEKLNWL